MKRAFLLAAIGLASIGAAPEQQIQQALSRLSKGYLAPKDIPDAAMILPPPPAPRSAALARDEEAQRAALALRGSARWAMATADADVFSPKATGAMSCAAGIEISPQATPKLDALMRRSFADLAIATRGAKAKYQRARPFMVNGQPNCTPEWDAILRKDGSYPSGHAAIGFGWGLILAELVPSRAAQLVSRGRAFADSRRICNVHWLSDVEEGSIAATATVARLHAEPAFQSDMTVARKEVAMAAPTKRDCAKEAAALAL
jgi:acid phosphatase (class A)